MKNYDYKDETKDVKGKVSARQKSKIPPDEEWISIVPSTQFELTLTWTCFIDWEAQCYLRAPTDAPGLEKCGQRDNPQSGWGHANDREKHLQTPTKRQEI